MTATIPLAGGMHSAERSAWGPEVSLRYARGGFRGHLARGLHLTWTSLKLLSKDPNLLALPLLALVLNGFVWLVVLVSLWGLGFPPWSPYSSFLYWELLVAYLVTNFLGAYFMAAILAASHARLDGRRPTVAEGVRAANGCLFRLLAWSLVASTLGVLLRLASLRYDGASRAVARVLGYTWPIASVFVLPAIVLEDLGPLKGFRRSRAILRDTWGSKASGILGTGAVFVVLALLGLIPFFWGLVGSGETALLALVASIVYWLLLASLWSVVHGTLVSALYHYAIASEASLGFSWQALNRPWVR